MLATASSTVDKLSPTVFHEEWWLDAATGGAYAVAEVHAGRTIGRLPYRLTRRWGLTCSTMPTLTPFLGPAVDVGSGSDATLFLKRLGIVRDLIQQLPPMFYFRMKCHRGIQDVIAFQDEGFETSVQFSHEITSAPNEVIWMNMRDKTRNVIRRSEEQVEVFTLDDPEEFMALYAQNLEARSIISSLDESASLQLLEESLRRGRGRILATRGDGGQVTAAIFCVWDESTCYYLMSTRAANAGNGDVSLLIWEAIKDASQRGIVFDFDGLSSPGGVIFFAGFGAVVSPRYVVTRSMKAFRPLLELREILHPNPYAG
jgi:Acetyltransferase (GNAT) domain